MIKIEDRVVNISLGRIPVTIKTDGPSFYAVDQQGEQVTANFMSQVELEHWLIDKGYIVSICR